MEKKYIYGFSAFVGIVIFPAQNTIVAGLSLGVVVTERAENSEALIAANYATKFHRPVFAVTGQITSELSKGTNDLIKQGAIAITSSGEVLDTLGIIAQGKSQTPSSKKQKEMQGKKKKFSVFWKIVHCILMKLSAQLEMIQR